MDYFHLDYPSVDFFVGRLQQRLRHSSSAALRGRLSAWKADVHGEPAFVAKIEMLNHALARLNADVTKLGEYLDSVPDTVEQCINEHRALSVPDRDLLWHLSLDLEAFLFEARSAYEILGKFLKEFFAVVFQRVVTQQEVIDAVRDLRGDVTWIPVLKENRDMFVHSAASWLAVERRQTKDPQFDLVLLKRNVKNLNEGDFVHFRDLRAVVQGLVSSVDKVTLWIVNEIATVEHNDAMEELL